MTTSHWTLALIVLCLIQGCLSTNEWGVSVLGPLPALEGSSAIFNCSFWYPGTLQPARNIIAIWLKDPCLEGSEELYNSNNPNRDPDVEWIGNLDQKNCSLRIKDVQKKRNHIFCFRFIIANKNKWTGKPGLRLIVYARPRTPVISPLELVEGVTTNLKCSSSNIDEKTKPSLKWYGLPDQSAEQCSKDPTVLSSCLRFTPSYQDHNKIINCSVTYSAFAYSDEASITLNVSYAPKNVTIRGDKGSELTIREGNQLSLMCTSNSNPEAMYSWHKREEESGETRLINGSKGTLSFQSITSSHSGFYSCTAANHVGSNTSKTLEIQVQYAPKNVTIQVDKGSELTIREGNKLSLMCTSDSNPEAMYSWHKREEESGETRLINGSKGILSFQSITSSDSGFYSCTAANHVGNSTSKTLEIQVQSSTGILAFAIAGSLVGIGLVLAIVLWIRRKDLFKGKKSENNSQQGMLDLQQGNETTISNSNIVYDRPCMNKSQGDSPSKESADTLVYASIQFNNKSKGLDSENPQLGQIKPGSKQQSHIDQSIDAAVYENMDKYKQSGDIIRRYPEDAVEYACVVFKNKTVDSKAANR
ncbi:B-cell receptor CD22-like isoform X5 [Hemiscyllium ocellatum]|uniref:B-cell receptor CD22-like isoform X5 n=1 Tax=Hemiscyllium ocellatum TaxID=170820 RepID=UPI002966AE76|nr:B-cell receptor CD22-like isoform X5 [Hemiscyllium ocellatum]